TSSPCAGSARTRQGSLGLLLIRSLLRLGRPTGRPLRERRRESDRRRHGVVVVPRLHLLPLLGGVAEVNAGTFLRNDPSAVRVKLRHRVRLSRERGRRRVTPNGLQAPEIL